MQLVLLKNVKGIDKASNLERLHANAGDVLRVLLRQGKNFICESKNYPLEHIVVFDTQAVIIEEPGGTIDDEIFELTVKEEIVE